MKSEFKFWRWAAVIGVLILGIVGSIAVAAPKGGGGGSSSSSSSDDAPKPSFEIRADVRGDGRHLSALAKELDVSTSKLKEALEAALEDVGPPDFKRNGKPPSRADIEKHCTEVTDALASKLSKSGDEVRAAIKNVAKRKIEAAVDAKRLTRAEADRILARINDADCLLPMGKFGFGGHGCGGGPGHLKFRHGPGRAEGPPALDGSERPAAPPIDGAALAL
jgi:hypothetical protein